EEVEVGVERLRVAVLGDGADDDAEAVGLEAGGERLEPAPLPRALDLLRDGDVVGGGDEDEEAAGERDVGGDAAALGRDGLLGDLDEDAAVAAEELLGAGRQRGRLLRPAPLLVAPPLRASLRLLLHLLACLLRAVLRAAAAVTAALLGLGRLLLLLLRLGGRFGSGLHALRRLTLGRLPARAAAAIAAAGALLRGPRRARAAALRGGVLPRGVPPRGLRLRRGGRRSLA